VKAQLYWLAPIKIMLRMLTDKPCSAKQIALTTGINLLTAHRYLKNLHAGYPENIIYVAKYHKPIGRGPLTAMYSFGPGMADVERPGRIGKEEKARRQRVKRLLLATTARKRANFVKGESKCLKTIPA
jgi:hypothetical protein